MKNKETKKKKKPVESTDIFQTLIINVSRTLAVLLWEALKFIAKAIWEILCLFGGVVMGYGQAVGPSAFMITTIAFLLLVFNPNIFSDTQHGMQEYFSPSAVAAREASYNQMMVEQQHQTDQDCFSRIGYGTWHGYYTRNWWGTKIICTNLANNQTMDLE